MTADYFYGPELVQEDDGLNYPYKAQKVHSVNKQLMSNQRYNHTPEDQIKDEYRVGDLVWTPKPSYFVPPPGIRVEKNLLWPAQILERRIQETDYMDMAVDNNVSIPTPFTTEYLILFFPYNPTDIPQHMNWTIAQTNHHFKVVLQSELTPFPAYNYEVGDWSFYNRALIEFIYLAGSWSVTADVETHVKSKQKCPTSHLQRVRSSKCRLGAQIVCTGDFLLLHPAKSNLRQAAQNSSSSRGQTLYAIHARDIHVTIAPCIPYTTMKPLLLPERQSKLPTNPWKHGSASSKFTLSDDPPKLSCMITGRIYKRVLSVTQEYEWEPERHLRSIHISHIAGRYSSQSQTRLSNVQIVDFLWANQINRGTRL